MQQIFYMHGLFFFPKRTKKENNEILKRLVDHHEHMKTKCQEWCHIKLFFFFYLCLFCTLPDGFQELSFLPTLSIIKLRWFLSDCCHYIVILLRFIKNVNRQVNQCFYNFDLIYACFIWYKLYHYSCTDQYQRSLIYQYLT